MKLIKKILATVVSLVMVLTMLPAMALAADSAAGPHVSCVASTTSAELGTTFTVTLKTSQMTICSFVGGINYNPDMVSVESIESTTGTLCEADEGEGTLEITFDNHEPNVGGYGAGTEDTTYAANDNLVTVTFRAIGEGDAVFTLYEDVDGTDEYKNDCIEGTTVTVNPEEYVTYVQADGTEIRLSSSDIRSCDQTENGNYLLSDVLSAAGITTKAECTYKMAGSDDYTVYYDADYYDDMALYYKGGWRCTYDTNAPGLSGGWYKVGNLATITEQNHVYGDNHTCTNLITIGRDADTRETLTAECGAIGTGIVTIDGTKYYYADGELQSDVTDVKKVDGNWYNLVEGVVTAGPTVAKNSNGWWYINADGVVDFTYTGFAQNKNGWWYVENGKVTFSKKDVIKDTAKTIDGTASWYFVSGSKVQFGVNSVEKNSKGWWYIKNGKVDFTYTGVAKNANGWWRIESGKVNFGFTGLAKNENGWWYLKSGKVDFTYSGLVKNAAGTWLVQKGKVNFSFTGTAYGKKIVNGKVK